MMDSGDASSSSQAASFSRASSAKPLLRFDGIGKRFGNVVAVDRVSLDIYEGEFFSLLGPSGSGKSTLLRILAGFEQPSEGRLLLDGEDIADVPPHRRPVNMMFQSYALFPHFTVAGNVAFGLKQEPLPASEIKARTRDILAMVQLEEYAERKPHQLSGGQRQRVALARALVKRPRLLLLDEPLSALDRKLREETRFELTALQRRLGLTFIMVTHDQDEAMALSDRIGVMNRGGLVQVASPKEIYEQPNSRWVAGFVGDVNLIEAQVSGLEAGATVLESVGGARLRVAQTIDASPGAMLWIAVRPEKILVSNDAPSAADENGLSGVVQDVGYLGDISVYKVRTDSGLVLKAAVANRRRLLDQAVNRGDRVWLRWAADAGVVLTQ